MPKLARVMLLIKVWLLIKRRVLLIRMHLEHHSLIIVITLELVVVVRVLVLRRHHIRMISSRIVMVWRYLISVMSLHHWWLVHVASHLLLWIVLIRRSLRPCTCSFFFNIIFITPFSFSPLFLTTFFLFLSFINFVFSRLN